mmetsp:Transcript_7908/g.14602  ORF Transcript_7908/g.14602 Transcript_7908/m.14602 type:complete len:179 (+) Transcript_7908:388-924(+)
MQQPIEDRHAPKTRDTRDRSDRKKQDRSKRKQDRSNRKQDRPSRAEEMKEKRKLKKDEIERVRRREDIFNSGVMYENGDGVKRDFEKAVELFKQAADQGHAGAQFKLGNVGVQLYLGVMYAKGEGAEQDFKEAVKWFRQAANQGDACAQCFLGDGVKPDFEKAVELFRQAACTRTGKE